MRKPVGGVVNHPSSAKGHSFSDSWYVGALANTVQAFHPSLNLVKEKSYSCITEGDTEAHKASEICARSLSLEAVESGPKAINGPEGMSK